MSISYPSHHAQPAYAQPAYAQPAYAPTYAAPQPMTYAAPQPMTYAAPQPVQYAPSATLYAAPVQIYAAPVQQYAAPVQHVQHVQAPVTYAAPVQHVQHVQARVTSAAPAQTYAAPVQTYAAPVQQDAATVQHVQHVQAAEASGAPEVEYAEAETQTDAEATAMPTTEAVADGHTLCSAKSNSLRNPRSDTLAGLPASAGAHGGASATGLHRSLTSAGSDAHAVMTASKLECETGRCERMPSSLECAAYDVNVGLCSVQKDKLFAECPELGTVLLPAVAAEALEGACSREIPGAMDIHEQSSAAQDRVSCLIAHLGISDVPRLPQAPVLGPVWSIAQSHELSNKEALNRNSNVLVDFEKVSTTVEALTRGDSNGIPGDVYKEGYCIVFHRKRKQHYLVYRSDSEEVVMEKFGFER